MIVIGMLGLLLVQQPSPDELWERGNVAYQDGRFEDAIAAYNALLEQGIDNGALHYNLGNAFLRSDKLGYALLHYYKAEYSMPFDRDLEHNIKVANQLREDPLIDEESDAFLVSVDRVLKSLDHRLLFWFAASLILLSGIASVGVCLNRFTSRAPGYVLVIAGVVGILLTGLVFVQDRHLGRTDFAVVISDHVDVMSGPSKRETVSFTVHEGIKCQIMDRNASWIRLRLANGYNGWVPRSSIARI